MVKDSTPFIGVLSLPVSIGKVLIIRQTEAQNGNAPRRIGSAMGRRAMTEKKKENPFTPKNKFMPWDAVHLETVCELTADENVTREEVLEFIIPALRHIELVANGQTCRLTRVGNTLIISKVCGYISLDNSDGSN